MNLWQVDAPSFDSSPSLWSQWFPEWGTLQVLLPTEFDNANLCPEREGVILGNGVLTTLMEVSGGDMRKAVTFLQSAHDLSGKNNVVTEDIVFDVSGRVGKRYSNWCLSVYTEIIGVSQCSELTVGCYCWRVVL